MQIRKDRKDDLWLPEPDQPKWAGILIKSALIMAALLIGILIYLKLHPSEAENTARGVETIKALEAERVSDVETTIRGIREQWTEGEAQEMAEESSNLKVAFQDLSTLIMGDSIVVALEDNGVLDSSTLVASAGASVGEADEALNTALAMAPWNFILAYGLDDVLSYGSNINGFIEDYSKIIDTFYAMRPSASVYVCEITSVSQEAAEEEPGYKKIAEYNEALQKMCRQKSLIYIQTQDMIVDYSSNGVIPSYEFFIPYATRIISTVQQNKNAHTYDPGMADEESTDTEE